jgi:uncharacterized membrane protein YphA (DoxX/SURF4 family)
MTEPHTRSGVFTSLPSPWNVGILLLAISLGVLGLISVVTGDFAFQWQPVSAEWPARVMCARLVGAVEVMASVAVLMPRTAIYGSGAITVIFWLWLLLLHVPRVIRGETASWIGACELLALAGASLALYSEIRASRSSFENGRSRDAMTVVGKVCFGFALLPLGLSHFVYAEPAAALIPAWFPAHLFFTYLTGMGHISAGLSIVSGVLARVAAPLLALMFACFVVFLHIPRVIATPTRYEFTMLLVSLALNGAAWIIAGIVYKSLKPTAA